MVTLRSPKENDSVPQALFVIVQVDGDSVAHQVDHWQITRVRKTETMVVQITTLALTLCPELNTKLFVNSLLSKEKS